MVGFPRLEFPNTQDPLRDKLWKPHFLRQYRLPHFIQGLFADPFVSHRTGRRTSHRVHFVLQVLQHLGIELTEALGEVQKGVDVLVLIRSGLKHCLNLEQAVAVNAHR